MGGDGAERTATEAPAMNVDRVLNHLKGRYCATFLVFRMRLPDVRQIKTGVDLVSGHRWFGRIDHHIAVAVPLHQSVGFYAVAFTLDDAEILCLCPFRLQAFLEGVKFDKVLNVFKTLRVLEAL